MKKSFYEKNMQVDLERAVNSYSQRGMSLLTPIVEAVTNSLQANATQIDIRLFYDDTTLINTTNDKSSKPTISSIVIEDNGDGFTLDNINSFFKLYSGHKIDDGCKGIGRLTYLKIFQNIHFRSKAQDSQIVDFDFDYQITYQKLQPKPSNSSDIDYHKYKNYNTDCVVSVMFSNPYEKYHNTRDIDNVAEYIYSQIYLLLFLRSKKLGKDVSLRFFLNSNEVASRMIESSDIKLNQESIQIADHTFWLYYEFVLSEKTVLNALYCANFRPSIKFKDKGISIVPPDKHRTTFLLTGDYLDIRATQARDDIYIVDDSQTSGQQEVFSELDWKQINNALYSKIRELISKSFPNINKENEHKIQRLKESYLHLADYIEFDKVGFVDEDELLNKARKESANEEDELNKLKNSNTSSMQDIMKQAKKVASNDLIRYILHRQSIIDELRDLKGTNIESQVHNLFLEQGLDGTEERQIPLDNNNLWLLDDKFMSYSYIASEKAISTFLNDIGHKKNGSNEEMDIVLYSDSNAKKRVVLLEMKKLNATYKENGVGIAQLQNYSSQLKKAGINEMYLYLIAEIEDRFRENLTTYQGFTKVFSQDGEVYQRSYDGVNAYIQIVSPNAIIADANARNKTFLDIIKKYKGVIK